MAPGEAVLRRQAHGLRGGRTAPSLHSVQSTHSVDSVDSVQSVKSVQSTCWEEDAEDGGEGGEEPQLAAGPRQRVPATRGRGRSPGRARQNDPSSSGSHLVGGCSLPAGAEHGGGRTRGFCRARRVCHVEESPSSLVPGRHAHSSRTPTLR